MLGLFKKQKETIKSYKRMFCPDGEFTADAVTIMADLEVFCSAKCTDFGGSSIEIQRKAIRMEVLNWIKQNIQSTGLNKLSEEITIFEEMYQDE